MREPVTETDASIDADRHGPNMLGRPVYESSDMVRAGESFHGPVGLLAAVPKHALLSGWRRLTVRRSTRGAPTNEA